MQAYLWVAWKVPTENEADDGAIPTLLTDSPQVVLASSEDKARAKALVALSKEDEFAGLVEGEQVEVAVAPF